MGIGLTVSQDSGIRRLIMQEKLCCILDMLGYWVGGELVAAPSPKPGWHFVSPAQIGYGSRGRAHYGSRGASVG